MDYMFTEGFLGTRAPFFMDFVMIMVIALPFLVFIAISFATKKNYRAHSLTHQWIFGIAVVVVSYFEYGVRVGGGYEKFSQGSGVSHDYSFIVLIFHIIVALIGFVIWLKLILNARKDSERKVLPGMNSAQHKKDGKRAFLWINLTAITGIWVYIILFVS